MAFYITNGFDRGNGTTLIPSSPLGSGFAPQPIGTPSPVNAIIINSSTGTTVPTEELQDSPTIERGSQCTANHRLRMDYNTALSLIGQISMGLIVQDSFGNIWRILTATFQPDPSVKGNAAILTTVSESVSFDSPPDEFQVNTMNLGIDLIKHPRYFPNLYPTVDDYNTSAGDTSNPNITIGQVKEAIIRAIQTYRDSPYYPLENVPIQTNSPAQNQICSGLINGVLGVFINSTSGKELAVNISASPSCLLAAAAAQEIIGKLWRMEDSPYLAGIEMKWSQYFFLPPYLNLGSYLEDPTLIIPDYFLKPDRYIGELPPRSGIVYPVAGSDNIFQLNSSINPQCYSANGLSTGATQISWLRQADEIEYQRTWFRITHTWIGSAIGYWDIQLYGAFNRPSRVLDYVQLAKAL